MKLYVEISTHITCMTCATFLIVASLIVAAFIYLFSIVSRYKWVFNIKNVHSSISMWWCFWTVHQPSTSPALQPKTNNWSLWTSQLSSCWLIVPPITTKCRIKQQKKLAYIIFNALLENFLPLSVYLYCVLWIFTWVIFVKFIICCGVLQTESWGDIAMWVLQNTFLSFVKKIADTC